MEAQKNIDKMHHKMATDAACPLNCPDYITLGLPYTIYYPITKEIQIIDMKQTIC